MGQRNQVVDHRDNAHALGLQAFGDGEELGVPGRVEQQQLVAGLHLQRCRPRGDLLPAANGIGEAQRQGYPQAGQLAEHEQNAPGIVPSAHRPAAIQARMPLPEIQPCLLQG
ncbi:hypothetical protein D3C85_1519860 [compost metagenome]